MFALSCASHIVRSPAKFCKRCQHDRPAHPEAAQQAQLSWILLALARDDSRFDLFFLPNALKGGLVSGFYIHDSPIRAALRVMTRRCFELRPVSHDTVTTVVAFRGIRCHLSALSRNCNKIAQILSEHNILCSDSIVPTIYGYGLIWPDTLLTAVRGQAFHRHITAAIPHPWHASFTAYDLNSPEVFTTSLRGVTEGKHLPVGLRSGDLPGGIEPSPPAQQVREAAIPDECCQRTSCHAALR